MRYKYKQEAIPAIIYFIISIAALIYVFIAPVGASLSGVGITLLTLPWSLIGVAILDHLRIGSVELSTVLSVVYILINTFIWLLVCGYFKKQNRNS